MCILTLLLTGSLGQKIREGRPLKAGISFWFPFTKGLRQVGPGSRLKTGRVPCPHQIHFSWPKHGPNQPHPAPGVLEPLLDGAVAVVAGPVRLKGQARDREAAPLAESLRIAIASDRRFGRFGPWPLKICGPIGWFSSGSFAHPY